MKELPDDLLVQILYRVPVKTILRCMSVSKRFFGLISTHINRYIYHRHILFQQMNEEEHENDCYLYCLSDFEALFFFSTRFLDPKFYLKRDGEIYETLARSRIVSCSNALVLLTERDDERQYYVCNPVAEWWIKLPYLPKCFSDTYYGLSEGFVCEPYYEVEGDTVTLNPRYRFRIVRIPWWNKRVRSKRKFKVVVFSSETRQWSFKWLSCPNDASFDPYNSHTGVANGGNLYFITEDNILMYDPFNNEEQYQTIDYPVHLTDEMYFNMRVGVCCGKIRIFTLQGGVISVWELEQDFSWCLLHHTYLPMPQGLNCRGKLQALHAHHGDVVYYRNQNHDGNFQANLKTKQVQKVASAPSPFRTLFVDLPLWPTPPPSIV